MNDADLADAVTRAERALERVQRASAMLAQAGRREATLRAKVQQVLVEFDELIRSAGAH